MTADYEIFTTEARRHGGKRRSKKGLTTDERR
jgi:hypothetical protein